MMRPDIGLSISEMSVVCEKRRARAGSLPFDRTVVAAPTVILSIPASRLAPRYRYHHLRLLISFFFDCVDITQDREMQTPQEATLYWSILATVFNLIMASLSMIAAFYSAKRSNEVKMNTITIGAIGVVQKALFDSRECIAEYEKASEQDRVQTQKVLKKAAETVRMSSDLCGRMIAETREIAESISSLAIRLESHTERSRFLYRSRLLIENLGEYNAELMKKESKAKKKVSVAR